jgi:hypothetical protein
MRFRPPELEWRAVRRRLCAGVTLLAYLATAIGFPVPAAEAKSASGGAAQVCCCGTPVQCKVSGCGCSHESEPEPPTCCTEKKPKDDSVRWVLGMSAKKCGGGLSDWIQADVAVPMPTPITWQPSWPYCHSLPISHDSSLLLSANPLDPPPRPDAV